LKQIDTLIYTTQAGDTFDLLALDYYDDERLAHLIMALNPAYSDVLVFDANVSLEIPIFDETATVETPDWRQA
jgi:hypothetical protein